MRFLLRDLRYALRGLSKSPGSTAVIVATLALGIGVNTLVFSLLDSLLLRPFRFPDLDRLVTIWQAPAAAESGPEVHRKALSPADFLDLRAETSSFERLTAFRYRNRRMTGTSDPVDIQTVAVDPEFFATLGARPDRGIAFGPADYASEGSHFVLLSHAFWTRQFASNPDVVSREIVLDGERYTVRGVLPAAFHYPIGPVDLWTPLAFTPAEAADRQTSSLVVLGRLKASVTPDRARSELDAFSRRLERRDARSAAGRGLTLVRLREEQAPFTGPLLAAFLAASGFVLLAACANVGNLLLARAVQKRQEIAIRRALGAGRAQIARQLLAESLLLGFGGFAASLWLVTVGLDGIRKSLPQGIAMWLAGWRDIGLDARALAGGAAVALATAALCTAAPLAGVWRAGLSPMFGRRGEGSSAFGRRAGSSRFLVVAQVSLALALLASAAAAVRGFRRLSAFYDEIDPGRVVTLHLNLSAAQADPARSTAAFDRILGAVQDLPETESAAFVSQIPADLGPTPSAAVRVEGEAAGRPNERPVSDLQAITPDYFRTLRIAWRRGRRFSDADTASSPPVAIVSAAAARRLFGARDPLGHRVAFETPGSEPVWRTIVGVAGDIRQYWVDPLPRPTFYVPLSQSPAREMFLAVRSRVEPAILVPALRRAIAGVDAGQPIAEVRTLRDVVNESAALVKIAASVLAATGAIALALGALGIFAMLSHVTSRSAKEIGIRVALGAGPGRVMRSVLGGAARLFAIGVALGVAGALALTRAVSALLFGVSPASDLRTLALSVLLLAAAAGAACYLPARRAAHLDPVRALRAE